MTNKISLQILKIACVLFMIIFISAKPPVNEDQKFDAFKERFIDAYMMNYPSNAIFEAYPKYNDRLKVPDKKTLLADGFWLDMYLDSVNAFSFQNLSNVNKISFQILTNELEKRKWYQETFKDYEWDPSIYNIGWDVYDILSHTNTPLHERLEMIGRYLENAPAFYEAAISNIKRPTREHTELGLQQNTGSVEVFEFMLADSIKTAGLSSAETNRLISINTKAIGALQNYIAFLQNILNDKNYLFRDYRIGKELFEEKFGYEIVSDLSATEIYNKAETARLSYYKEMYRLTGELWPKYFTAEQMPADTFAAIAKMINIISLQHASPENLFDTLQQHLKNLKTFIVNKQLFDFDINAQVNVRLMPAFAMGVTIASASFPPVFQEDGIAYYNISDLTVLPPEESESMLREYNNYTLQILSIHEGIPGHCLQGIYNKNNSSDKITAVFGNGTMIEGWANYCKRMMIENGWGNNTPEMWLEFYKSALRECCNVIIDYGIHCLSFTEADVYDLLVNKAFQEDAQVREKYKRAKLTQVQLCSYFTGNTEMNNLLQQYKMKKGKDFKLIDFHEQFLSYGSAPIKYIGALMLSDEN